MNRQNVPQSSPSQEYRSPSRSFSCSIERPMCFWNSCRSGADRQSSSSQIEKNGESASAPTISD